jgi:hypothetical protein
MHGTSLQAPLELEKVDHAPFSVDLYQSETAGPSDTQLVAATEEPSGSMRHV